MSPGDSAQPDARLVRLLGKPELAPLRQRLRRHFERHGAKAGRTLQLTKLTSFEQEALSLMLGRRPRNARSMSLDIQQLDLSLRDAGIAESLRAALELLDGPIEDRAALREIRRLRWERVIHAERWHPTLHPWLQASPATALLKRLARGDTQTAEQLLEQASIVLQRLPAAGITRAQLAAETLGNAHALDNGYPTATLILSSLRHDRIIETLATPALRSAPPKDPERAREIWARAGVLVNELARPALCLNLPWPLRRTLGAPAGQPNYLSLRTLLRTPPAWHLDGETIYVCENPNVVAIAADQLGARCAPLVCTDGMPAAAQRTLLTQLVDAGARLLYHGDFDWPGLNIANFVMRNWSASPWRFGADDYEKAVLAAPHRPCDLSATSITASWDELLTTSMAKHGLAIAEEAVVPALLKDLMAPE